MAGSKPKSRKKSARLCEPTSPEDTVREWRRRADQLFRYLHRDLEPILREDDSIYAVCDALVPLCVRAHEAKHGDDLRAIYCPVS